MALSKTQKDDVVAEVADLLKSAKMTVLPNTRARP